MRKKTVRQITIACRRAYSKLKTSAINLTRNQIYTLQSIGNGEQWFPWMHVDDLAELFKFAIVNDHVTGIINGVAPEQARNKDFAKTFAGLMNRPAIIPMPAMVVKLLFGPERADILLAGMRVKSRAGLLGFHCKYPTLLEACRESLNKR